MNPVAALFLQVAATVKRCPREDAESLKVSALFDLRSSICNNNADGCAAAYGVVKIIDAIAVERWKEWKVYLEH